VPQSRIGGEQKASGVYSCRVNREVTDAEGVEEERLPLLTRIRRVLGRIRRSCTIDTYDVFARAVTDEHLEFESPEGYRFAWGTAEDIERCSTFHTELDEEERRLGIERLKLDHRVVIAFSGETAVFSMWMNPRNLNVPGEIKRQLSPTQAFIYKAFTSPDHRGKGLYKVGMRFVLNHMALAGQTELIGYAHIKKSVSRKGLASLEFTTKGRYHFQQVGSWQTTRVEEELARNFPVEVARSNAIPN
jgi:hypothetical protein